MYSLLLSILYITLYVITPILSYTCNDLNNLYKFQISSDINENTYSIQLVHNNDQHVNSNIQPDWIELHWSINNQPMINVRLMNKDSPQNYNQQKGYV